MSSDVAPPLPLGSGGWGERVLHDFFQLTL